MLDFVAEEIAACVAGLLGRLVPPLGVEVRSLSFQSPGATPRDESSGPIAGVKRYHVELLLSNRRGTPVSVRGIILAVNHGKQYEIGGDAAKIQLKAHEASPQHIVFPLSPDDIPDQAGQFRLTVIPTRGRPTAVAGDFPT